jgi:hypothetical protein
MEIVRNQIQLVRLRQMAEERFGDLLKAVVDVEGEIMAIDAELHSDQEATLLDAGSRQRDLWGINLYPADYGTEGWIEFDSMINVRPSQGNRSRSIEDAAVRERIVAIVDRLVTA